MLTNQLIGAAHNIATHTPRYGVAEAADAQTSPVAAEVTSGDQLTALPVNQKSNANGADLPNEERPPLEVPKRAELSVAVPDSIPDAQPESIYHANAAEPIETPQP